MNIIFKEDKWIIVIEKFIFCNLTLILNLNQLVIRYMHTQGFDININFSSKNFIQGIQNLKSFLIILG